MAVQTMPEGVFLVTEFGADPNGKTDSSPAFQSAIDQASKAAGGQGGVVLVPPGIYLCRDVQLRPQVRLQGSGTWGYRTTGCCVLRLPPDAQDACCVLNLTGAFSCTVENLVLQGRGEAFGAAIHGFYLHHDVLGMQSGRTQEDIPTLRNCKAEDFSGDGIHFHNIWCFRLLDCQVRRCEHGLSLGGVDGFILNCWFSKNRGWGIQCEKDCGPNAAEIVTACRIEWNAGGGILLTSAEKWQIGNTSFDRNGGPAVAVQASKNRRCPECHTITLSGNLFNRNGFCSEGEANCHLLLHDAFNIAVTGNSFLAGAEDNYQGQVSPQYCVVAGNLKSVVISGNVMQNGCTKQTLLDLGSHCEDEDNSGLLWQQNVGAPASGRCYAVSGYFMPAKE